jgi:hypothetical protein
MGARLYGLQALIVSTWLSCLPSATLADIYSDGERLTCVVPGRQACSGRIEISPAGWAQAWAMMRWVVEGPPSPGPPWAGERLGGGVRNGFSTMSWAAGRKGPKKDMVSTRTTGTWTGLPFRSRSAG